MSGNKKKNKIKIKNISELLSLNRSMRIKHLSQNNKTQAQNNKTHSEPQTFQQLQLETRLFALNETSVGSDGPLVFCAETFPPPHPHPHHLLSLTNRLEKQRHVFSSLLLRMLKPASLQTQERPEIWPQTNESKWIYASYGKPFWPLY